MDSALHCRGICAVQTEWYQQNNVTVAWEHTAGSRSLCFLVSDWTQERVPFFFFVFMSGANKMKRDELWMVQREANSSSRKTTKTRNIYCQHTAQKVNKTFRDNLVQSPSCPSTETIIRLFYDPM